MRIPPTTIKDDSIGLLELIRRTKAQDMHGVAAESGFDAELDGQEKPTISDLATQLRFSPRTGRIWLGDQRMLLLHGKTFAALRHELIERLGFGGARAMLMRVGYASGARDAGLVRKAWPADDEVGAFTAGTRLHALEGVVKVMPIKVMSDISHGRFRGDYFWHDSLEAAEFVTDYGVAHAPTCWMQVGYASGYASAFLGKLVVFRELQCAGMGAPCCRILGQPADDWEEQPDECQILNDPEPTTRSARVISLPTEARDPIARTTEEFAHSSKPSYGMVGISAAFTAARYRIERVASTPATVLFVGESGVGKELFAKALHELSPRRDQAFVAVNCAAIPDTLIESELFGVEKGAFTGASTSRAGRFERASGGTLFLDEIPTLSLISQGKLLRAIQEREIDRVGGTRASKVDVRVVAATNLDLRAEVQAGRFREDLYFRLNVFPIRLPPLRERRDDIPLLLDHFLNIYNRLYGKSVTGFHRRAVEALLNYDYPGNIRELQNIVERGVISARDQGTIDVQDIFQAGDYMEDNAMSVSPAKVRGTHAENHQQFTTPTPPTAPPRIAPDAGNVIGDLLANDGFSLVQHEREIYEQALKRAHGNVAAAARLLGLRRAQLAYRLKSLGKR